MFKPGMKVRHRALRAERIATLLNEKNTSRGTGWRISINGAISFWYERNMIPVANTNQEALVFLNKADTF